MASSSSPRRCSPSPSSLSAARCSSSGTRISPISPAVQVTRVTPHPSATYLAIVAPVPIVSSSGWACTRSRRWSGMGPSLATVGLLDPSRLPRKLRWSRCELASLETTLGVLEVEPAVERVHEQLEHHLGSVGEDSPRVVLVVVLAREPLSDHLGGEAAAGERER